ncbi:hypothetical protein CEXT_389131 [Caerostris extrusa]|uniref:Signal transducer and activator of transcription n=1 Tax=Caerostris extrusa TaxID=172846 RepID=A0AAV4TD88_CAEEX|nr:hypothetical protein CEXT_389131 [Caerostris extrusa]
MMALWARVQQLHGEALQQIGLLYGDNFPIDEAEMDPDNPQHDVYIGQIINNFFSQLEAKQENVDFLTRLKLNEAVNEFRAKYSNNPQHLVRIIKHCLNSEMRIVQQTENYLRGGSTAMHLPPDPIQEISVALDKLRHRTQESGEDLRKMIQCQEAFVIQYQESSKPQIQQSSDVEFIAKLQKEKQLYDNAVRNHIQELMRLRMKLGQHFTQQLHGNGEPFHNNLDQIQEWCEALADIIWQNRQQIRQVESLVTQVPILEILWKKLPMLNSSITGLLSSLVTSTFIIEKQPPQVLKTNTRFSATVRLLVGSKLSVYMTPPQVKVTIISEAQAIALLKNDKVGPGEASGEILNNMGTMEYHQATRQLSVSFRNLLKKKGTESVMDEKFSLLFQSQFKVGGGELVFQVWTLSLPVVVIVHGNQDPHAWATITWDNAFAEPVCSLLFALFKNKCMGRVPFQVPDKVRWKEVADVLSTKFKSGTGRALSEDNLQFLAGKVFQVTSGFVDPESQVTWSQFCKEPLPERNFTFWEWFYAIMKVTREHLRNLWNDGLIIGFIGRHQAEEMLLQKCNGTFLLRFSDSEAGGVTIAWVADSQTREGQEVFMVQPFTSRDFAIRAISDRISDLKTLLYLYPDIPKDQAFWKILYTIYR